MLKSLYCKTCCQHKLLFNCFLLCKSCLFKFLYCEITYVHMSHCSVCFSKQFTYICLNHWIERFSFHTKDILLASSLSNSCFFNHFYLRLPFYTCYNLVSFFWAVYLYLFKSLDCENLSSQKSHWKVFFLILDFFYEYFN